LSFTALTLSGCGGGVFGGVHYWTAGHTVEPTNPTNFIWKVKSTTSETVSEMGYTNWCTGEPNFHDADMIHQCVQLYARRSYGWNDHFCYSRVCSVCEVNI